MRISSLDIARLFGKRHDSVMRDIRNLINRLPPGTADLDHEFVEFPCATGQRAAEMRISKQLARLLYKEPISQEVWQKWNDMVCGE